MACLLRFRASCSASQCPRWYLGCQPASSEPDRPDRSDRPGTQSEQSPWWYLGCSLASSKTGELWGNLGSVRHRRLSGQAHLGWWGTSVYQDRHTGIAGPQPCTLVFQQVDAKPQTQKHKRILTRQGRRGTDKTRTHSGTAAYTRQAHSGTDKTGTQRHRQDKNAKVLRL
jgi:hypothetical protein